MKTKWPKQTAADVLIKSSELLGQGYPLDEVLQLVSFEQNDDMKERLYQMRLALRAGIPLHEVLKEQLFPSDVTAYVYFSEQFGSLEQGLYGAGELYLKRIHAWQSIKKLMSYPLLLLWLLVFVAMVMVHFLFPQFRALFDSLHMDFPLLTLIMLQLFQYAPLLFLVLFCLLGVCFLYYFKRFRHYSSQKQVHLLLQVPFVRSSVRLFLTYYFALQFGSMLKGGLSVYEALQVFEKQHHFPFFQDEGRVLKQQLKDGYSLNEALAKADYYRKDLTHVIQHGQASGKLGYDLYFYSEKVLNVLEEKTKKWMMTMQPIMFCAIGIVILAMFLSVFLPMFQLMTTI
ncbi:competence-related pilin export protein ComGB [Alteribacillus persepolensis]|uniref:Competence-related pilin export protein ComGB n=1 Tax=Alteribacillus persepolensis TaxID=568899 RepID=A0A1G8CWN0_9BACI|nr:competence type IV pilus assembly protein ComGB [Alteribacillus persepolensis]SDH49895.1 competence-related pilin export protein ComGB [Alteribacillus persepolensis]